MNQVLSNTNDSSFEQDVLQSTLPVLVDFWADWCSPCKSLAPILEELQAVYPDTLKILKLNVDENRIVPTTYDIRSLPTLLLFKNTQIKARKVGLLSKSQLMTFLDNHLQSEAE